MTGTLTPPGFAPTGGRLSFETADFPHFEGGLLLRHTVELNMLDLARQIGAVPQSGTLGGRVGVWGQHVAAFWARARQARVPLRQCVGNGQCTDGELKPVKHRDCSFRGRRSSEHRA
jgi:hypothetical protein